MMRSSLRRARALRPLSLAAVLALAVSPNAAQAGGFWSWLFGFDSPTSSTNYVTLPATGSTTQATTASGGTATAQTTAPQTWSIFSNTTAPVPAYDNEAGVLPFYLTPASYPANNGDIVRSEVSQFFLSPLKITPANASVYRVMFRTTNHRGELIPGTATVLIPYAQWTGTGPRPLVALAPGTQGQGDKCAPSRLMASGLEYEGPMTRTLLDKGWAVVVVDYQGLGTEGVHMYMNRATQAHTVLDAARAAQRLPQSGLNAAGPVGIMGYSQGGGAAAAAAELAPVYAPELQLKGTAAGAAPADLAEVGTAIDGTMFAGFLLYSINSNTAAYGGNPADILNAKGLAAIETAKTQCVAETVTKFAFMRSQDITKDGRSMAAIMATEPYASLIAEQKIGVGRRPATPVLLTHSIADDTIPYKTGKGLAQRWCQQGATVTFLPGVGLGHGGGMMEYSIAAPIYLQNRFNGAAPINSCGLLPTD